jgi:hypothetical protein
MGWILFILVVAAGLVFWPRHDPMANLLDELEARDLISKILAVPRYERIVRESLAEKDDDR